MARLDRFLVLDNWEVHFGNVAQTILPKPLSDHFPILLVGGGEALIEALHLFDSKTCGSRLMDLKIRLLSGGRILFSKAPIAM